MMVKVSVMRVDRRTLLTLMNIFDNIRALLSTNRCLLTELVWTLTAYCTLHAQTVIDSQWLSDCTDRQTALIVFDLKVTYLCNSDLTYECCGMNVIRRDLCDFSSFVS